MDERTAGAGLLRRGARPGLRLHQRQRLSGWAFVAPTLAVLASVVLIPLTASVLFSISSYTFLRPRVQPLVGLANFQAALADQYFWNASWVTIKYVVLVVAVEFTLGLGIALLLNAEIRFKGVYYTILTIPMVMSPVGVGLIWKLLLHPDLGIVNYVLSLIGLPGVDWLGSPDIAFWTVLLVDVWQQVSFMILVLLAGLVSLPREPFEAAEIDGASPWQRLLYVTLPLLRPVAIIAVLIRTINAFRTYDLVYVMTRGGPGVSTDIISYFIYRVTFLGLNLSQAAAISVLLLGVVMLFAVGLFSRLGRQSDVA